MSTEELAELRRRLTGAAKGGARTPTIARSLGVSENEILGLQRVLDRPGTRSTPLVRATVLSILGERPIAAGPTVYVVGRSEVYHRTASCEFARDAKRREMTEPQAKKRGLRVCKHCKNEADAPHLVPIKESSVLEGAPDGPALAGRASRAAKKAKPPKKVRDRAEAARLGITVDELKTRRRAQAERDARLGERARALGITTKRLRKLIAEGAESAER